MINAGAAIAFILLLVSLKFNWLFGGWRIDPVCLLLGLLRLVSLFRVALIRLCFPANQFNCSLSARDS